MNYDKSYKNEPNNIPRHSEYQNTETNKELSTYLPTDLCIPSNTENYPSRRFDENIMPPVQSILCCEEPASDVTCNVHLSSSLVPTSHKATVPHQTPTLRAPSMGETTKPYKPEQCLIVQGLAESLESVPKKRTFEDLRGIQKCIESILSEGDHVEIHKAYRLGALKEDMRPRPLKLILGDENQVKMLLQRKHHFRTTDPTVFFQREYTPKEREKHRCLVTQLKQRQLSGEQNLVIQNGMIVRKQIQFLWKNPFSISM
jgi:hypothetical protein